MANMPSLADTACTANSQQSRPQILGLRREAVQGNDEFGGILQIQQDMRSHDLRIQELETLLTRSNVQHGDREREMPKTPATFPLVRGVTPVSSKSAFIQSKTANAKLLNTSNKDMSMFDHMLLQSIYDKPHQELMHQFSLIGIGFVGLLSMPFGPIGMFAGGVCGGLCGGLLGRCADRRRKINHLAESGLEKKRLKSLLRWAAETFCPYEPNAHRLIELVILEFKPMADIADGSKNARKLLTCLDCWMSQKAVMRQLWSYLDSLLQIWLSLTRGDFVQKVTVLQTVLKVLECTPRVLSDQDMNFKSQIEVLLDHTAVKSVMEHAEEFPSDNATRAMACMVFADHAQIELLRKKTNDGWRSPSDLAKEEDADSDDSGSMQDLADTQSRPKSQSSEKVLKKPFFKDWNDFMEFDTAFKHKMPITLSEKTLLLEKEVESLKGWDICIDRPELKVGKVQTGTGCITLRVWATIPGVYLHVAFYLFHCLEERQKWDKVLQDMTMVDDDFQGSDVVYSVMRITGVTPRDFLQFRRVFLQEDGSIAIVLRSADHDERPEARNNIRVESYISGYVLRQFWDGEEPVLQIFLMSCSDVKGLIPKWIINFVAPKKPSEWLESLTKACKNYQEIHKNNLGCLRDYAERFLKGVPYDWEHCGGSSSPSVTNGTPLVTSPSVNDVASPREPGEARLNGYSL